MVVTESSNAVVNDVRELFLSMPEPVVKAFEFVMNYILAFDIVKSSKKVFIIESYHHAICARNVCEKIQTEAGVLELDFAVFDWPLDLPLPELVSVFCLFLNHSMISNVNKRFFCTSFCIGRFCSCLFPRPRV